MKNAPELIGSLREQYIFITLQDLRSKMQIVCECFYGEDISRHPLPPVLHFLG